MIQAFIKQSSPGFLVVGLLLALSGKLSAQELYKSGPVMKLTKIGVVDQLVNGSSTATMPDARGEGVRHSSANEIRASRPLQSAPAEFADHASYQTSSPQQDDWQQILNAGANTREETLIATNERQSFIEREKPDVGEKRESARDLISKISINLMFVLAIAFGFVLLAKQWQKSKLTQQVKPSAAVDTLKVSQVLPLTNGASLHVVEGFGNKCLVAIDASGIKSVNVLTPTFDETLERTETIAEAPELRIHEPIENDESTTKIDESLIRLLLQSSKKAA